MSSILIAFFSHSGNTKKLAQHIARETGGTLWEIFPEKAYPAAYDTVVEQAKKEILSGYRPPLQAGTGLPETYDMVFVGTPNWWSSLAPPVATFLESHDFSKKTVVPFCTHGGGGFGHIERDIAKLCPNSILKPGFCVYGNRNADLSAWLKGLGIV